MRAFNRDPRLAWHVWNLLHMCERLQLARCLSVCHRIAGDKIFEEGGISIVWPQMLIMQITVTILLQLNFPKIFEQPSCRKNNRFNLSSAPLTIPRSSRESIIYFWTFNNCVSVCRTSRSTPRTVYQVGANQYNRLRRFQLRHTKYLCLPDFHV
jgi:hypothetical protein